MRVLRYLATGAILFLIYFAGLGHYPLMDPDEPVYGRVAAEMVSSGNWLTPHYYGKLWFDKPPMFYWLSAISTGVFGGELGARFFSAFFAVLLVFMVYKLASYDFGRKAGMLSAAVMGTCFLQIWLAHAAVTDMTFVFFLTAALYGYRRWLDAESGKRFLWMALCGVATGLAMLTKGPVAPVLLFVTFIIHLLLSKRLVRLLSLDALAGIASALVVGMPWFVAMFLMHREAFVNDFIMVNNVGRFTSAEHAGTTGKWYSYFANIPILFAFFFPWSFFLPAAIRTQRKANDGAKLAWVWFSVVFLFFSISKTILITYIFPLYPAAAILVGAFCHKAASKDNVVRRSIKRGLVTGVAVTILLAALVMKYVHKSYPEAQTTAAVFVGILVATMAIGLIYVVSLKGTAYRRAPHIIAGGMVALSVWLIFGIAPVIEATGSTRDVVGSIPSICRSSVVAYCVENPSRRLLRYPSLPYYLGHKPMYEDDAGDVRAFLAYDKPAFVICHAKEADKVRVPGSVIWATAGKFRVVANAAAVEMKGSEVR